MNIDFKRVGIQFVYALSISFIFLLLDEIYSYYNDYFIFHFTSKELFNKMGLLIFVVSFFKNIKLRMGLYAILLLFSFFQYVHFSYFGTNISGIEFYLFATNIDETFETLNSVLSIISIPLSLVIIGFMVIYFIDRFFSSYLYSFKYNIFIFILGFIYLFSNIFYLTNLHKGKLKHSDSKRIYPLTNRDSARNFFVSFNYFIAGILPQKLFFSNRSFPILPKPILLNRDINRTIIFVIGESLRYDKFRLDNNKLTPKLQSLTEDKNFFFKKVYSGGTMTKVSVSTLINRLKYPQGLSQISKEDNCLFKLAKENGFSTRLISAQNDFHMQMLRDMVCPKYIDTFLTRDNFKNYIKPTGYDEDLESLVKKEKLLHSNTFLVLHQRGSHSPYEEEYPQSYNNYSSYENTALYNDTQLYNLINYVKQNSKGEFFIFYVSDHGELLGEYGKKGHGHLVKEVYEVPFLMYTNSKNQALREQFKYVRNHYDISNYLLSLLGYKADLIKDEDRSIYILNADLDGFSGYGVIDINNSIESKLELKKY